MECTSRVWLLEAASVIHSGVTRDHTTHTRVAINTQVAAPPIPSQSSRSNTHQAPEKHSEQLPTTQHRASISPTTIAIMVVQVRERPPSSPGPGPSPRPASTVNGNGSEGLPSLPAASMPRTWGGAQEVWRAAGVGGGGGCE